MGKKKKPPYGILLLSALLILTTTVYTAVAETVKTTDHAIVVIADSPLFVHSYQVPGSSLDILKPEWNTVPLHSELWLTLNPIEYNDPYLVRSQKWIRDNNLVANARMHIFARRVSRSSLT